MKPPPEDGSLEELTSSALNPDNVIIIERSDELKEPGETTYTLATCDRSREGVEWPGDQFLEKLIPELPKVKVPEVSKPEVTTKTNTQRSYHVRRKLNQRPVQRDNHFTTRHSKPPHKKFRYNRPEDVSNIEPWIHNPWENQPFFSRINASASVSTTPLISNMPFNNFYTRNSTPSNIFASRTRSNIYNFPNNSVRNMIPTAASNIPFPSGLAKRLNRSTANRMPCGPRPSFQPPNRFLNQHPGRGFSGPGTGHTQNVNFNGPPRKQGLLGDSPFPEIPFNRNLATFPNSISSHSDPERDTATLLSRDQENTDDQKNFVSNTKNSTFRDASETNYSGFHNPGSSVNRHEDQYRGSYNNLNRIPPNNNKKNIISLKRPRDSYKTNFGRFKNISTGASRSVNSYVKVGNDNLCENSCNESQVSNIPKASSFKNNQTRNPAEESIIHISNSYVVYGPEGFQNDGCPATATNSVKKSKSNLNSVSRPNIRRNIPSKNTLWPKKRWPTNNLTNSRQNRVKYNQGQHKFRNWRTSQK